MARDFSDTCFNRAIAALTSLFRRAPVIASRGPSKLSILWAMASSGGRGKKTPLLHTGAAYELSESSLLGRGADGRRNAGIGIHLVLRIIDGQHRRA